MNNFCRKCGTPIILFCTMTIALVLFTVRQTFTQEKVENMLNGMEATELIDVFYEYAENTDDGSEIVLSKMNRYLMRKGTDEISEEDLNDLVDESSFKTYIAGEVATYVNDICSDSDDFSIDAEEVGELLVENSDVIEDELDLFLPSSFYERLAEKSFNYDRIESYSPEEIKDEMPLVYNIARVVLSYVTFGVFVLFAVLLVVAMMRNNVSQAVAGVGINFTILGVITGGVSIVAMLLPETVASLIPNSAIGLLLGRILAVNYDIFGAVFAIGVLTLVVRAIVLKVIAKYAQKKEEKQSAL